MADAVLSRRAGIGFGAMALGLLLAGCGGREPQKFEPLRYDYLTKIKLNVARVDIDSSWAPRGSDHHVEFLAPTPPLDALRHMAEDRLVPGGTASRALFTVVEASIIRQGDTYRATLAVRLDILNEDGDKVSGIEARATGVHLVTGSSTETVRSDLYDLTRKSMDDMNVEFEYQIRHSLQKELQNTSPSVPGPAPVDTEDLDAPGTKKTP
jgi:hypothetical protein